MSFENRPPQSIQRSEQMRILQSLVNESLQLRDRFDQLSHAVYRVLDNHHIRNVADRKKLFGEIMTELRKRKKTSEGSQKRQDTKDLSENPTSFEMDTQQMMFDAIARQKNEHIVPPSAWDPNHPENSP